MARIPLIDPGTPPTVAAQPFFKADAFTATAVALQKAGIATTEIANQINEAANQDRKQEETIRAAQILADFDIKAAQIEAEEADIDVDDRGNFRNQRLVELKGETFDAARAAGPDADAIVRSRIPRREAAFIGAGFNRDVAVRLDRRKAVFTSTLAKQVEACIEGNPNNREDCVVELKGFAQRAATEGTIDQVTADKLIRQSERSIMMGLWRKQIVADPFGDTSQRISEDPGLLENDRLTLLRETRQERRRVIDEQRLKDTLIDEQNARVGQTQTGNITVAIGEGRFEDAEAMLRQPGTRRLLGPNRINFLENMLRTARIRSVRPQVSTDGAAVRLINNIQDAITLDELESVLFDITASPEISQADYNTLTNLVVQKRQSLLNVRLTARTSEIEDAEKFLDDLFDPAGPRAARNTSDVTRAIIRRRFNTRVGRRGPDGQLPDPWAVAIDLAKEQAGKLLTSQESRIIKKSIPYDDVNAMLDDFAAGNLTIQERDFMLDLFDLAERIPGIDHPIELTPSEAPVKRPTRRRELTRQPPGATR